MHVSDCTDVERGLNPGDGSTFVDLVGGSDIMRRLGVSRTTFERYRTLPEWPEVVVHVSHRPTWQWADVCVWAVQYATNRRPSWITNL